MCAAVQSSQASTSSGAKAQATAIGKNGVGNANGGSGGAGSLSRNETDRKPSTSSKPIQWATSTGATVLQHLAATREQQQKLKGTKLTSNDLINSKPIPPPTAKTSNAPPSATSTKAGSLKNASPSTSKPKSVKPSASVARRPSLPSTTAPAKVITPSKKDVSKASDEEASTEKKPARRRKANRACSHCQKAHLTCEDSRPCERCVKKGLADSCTDGARKKAKYLLDDDELMELKREKERKALAEAATSTTGDTDGDVNGGESSIMPEDVSVQSVAGLAGLPPTSHSISWDPGAVPPGAINLDPYSAPSQIDTQPQSSNIDLYGQLSSSSFSPSSVTSGVRNTFGSENASLEYSILSSMLNGIDPSWLSGSPDQQSGTETDVGSVYNGAFSHMGIDGMPWQFAPTATNEQQLTVDSSPWRDALRTSGGEAPHSVEALHHLDATLIMGGGATPGDDIAAYDALEVPSPKAGTTTAAAAAAAAAIEAKQNGGNVKAAMPTPASALTNTTEQEAQKSKAAAAAAAAGLDHKPDAVWRERVKHIYGDKTRPFPYTEGYHFLIKYVTANLDKADVLRIVRALAIFRPSLIALQMPMTEDDEIFVERSIQRTILEFEKLISFSGTPTVVWRRTCEVVVVGAEFSMLTQWSKDYLMGRYIYEFFEKPSILEYWEKFASHAFENTAQSIMMPVTLKTSTGSSTRCAACFSIKRDIFDLPSLIVGNFLPILS